MVAEANGMIMSPHPYVVLQDASVSFSFEDPTQGKN